MRKFNIVYPNPPEPVSTAIVPRIVAGRLLGLHPNVLAKQMAKGYWTDAMSALGDQFKLEALAIARGEPITTDEVTRVRIDLARERAAAHARRKERISKP